MQRFVTRSHGTKNIHTMGNYVETKGKDKRSKRLNALGILLYINTKTHGETQKTRRKDGWNAGSEHMSDSPGRRTTERRGGKQLGKERARKLEGACSWRKKQKAACDYLGEEHMQQLGEVEQDPPSLLFLSVDRSGAEREWLMWREHRGKRQ